MEAITYCLFWIWARCVFCTLCGHLKIRESFVDLFRASFFEWSRCGFLVSFFFFFFFFEQLRRTFSFLFIEQKKNFVFKPCNVLCLSLRYIRFGVFNVGWSPRGVVTNVLDSDIIESEFEFKSRYYVHFQTNILGKLIDKIKRSFFQAAIVSILLYGCTTWTLTKRMEKKIDGNYARMLEQVLEASFQKSSSCIATYHPSRKLQKLDEPDTRDNAGEIGTSS